MLTAGLANQEDRREGEKMAIVAMHGRTGTDLNKVEERLALILQG